MDEKRNNIQFLITPEQAEQICHYYNVETKSADDFEICDLLNQLIDEVTIEH